MLRFINDYGEENNCYVVIIPKNDRWAIYYIASRDIQEGDELTVNYGGEYW